MEQQDLATSSSSSESFLTVMLPAAATATGETIPASSEPMQKEQPVPVLSTLEISLHDGTELNSSSSGSSSMHAGSSSITAPSQQLVTSKSGKLSEGGTTTTRGHQLPRPGLRSRATLDRNGSTLGAQVRTPGSSTFVLPSSTTTMPLPPPPPQMSSHVSPLFSKRTTSLPVNSHHINISSCSPAAPSFQWQAPSSLSSEPNGAKSSSILRSISMPLRRGSSGTLGRTTLLVVRPATESSATTKKEDCLMPQTVTEKDEKRADQEISEEQAVCRICMDDLTEEYGETLKMECSCRGEMALAHRECALKWFSIKGNRTCDVCGREVSNLPVTVVRLPNESTGSSRLAGQTPAGQENFRRRVWQDVPVLVMISMLAYFCFLEQLLVGKLGSGAIVIALPFACILGFLAAIVASNLVVKQLIWFYATCQFGLIISFAHLFYDLVHVEAVLAILLASFAGFGIAMTSSALIIEYANWKRRAAAPVQQSPDSTVMDEGSREAEVRTNAMFPAPTEDHPELRLLPHDIENPPTAEVHHPVPIEHSLTGQNLSHAATSYSEGLGIHHAFQGH